MSVLDTIIYKAVILKSGEPFVLPPQATVQAVTGTLSSTCDNLPEAETLNCYYFQWEVTNVSNNDSDAWEGAGIDKISLAGVDYTIDADGFLPENDGAAILQAAMSNVAGITSISTHSEALGNDQINSVCFRTTPSIAAKLVLHLHSNGRPGYTNGVTKMQQLAMAYDSVATCNCS